MNRAIHVIWNDHASQAEKYGDLLSSLKQRADVDVYVSESAEDAKSYSTQLARHGTPIIVAAGGDGTVNIVMEGILAANNRNASLGVLPLGTGNDFSRNALIPWDPIEAFSLIEQRQSQLIDVVQVRSVEETFHFLNMATGGNTGLYSEWITEDMKKFWGPLTYLRGAIDIVANLVVFEIEVTFDNQMPENYQALNLFLANGSVTGGGLPVAPDAEIDDGLIDVIIVLDCTPVEMAGLVTQYTLSDYLTNEHILYRRCRSLSLKSSPALMLTADGDTRSDHAITAEVLSNRLSVVTGMDKVSI